MWVRGCARDVVDFGQGQLRRRRHRRLQCVVLTVAGAPAGFWLVVVDKAKLRFSPSLSLYLSVLLCKWMDFVTL